MKQYAAYAFVNGKGVTYDEAQKKLASYVELQMVHGWIPQGGVIFVGLITELNEKSWEVTNFVFCQAMMKPVAEQAPS